MTTADRFDRRVEAALTELAVPRFPEYFDDVLQVTARTTQRPAWRHPERWLPMSVIALGRTAAPSRSWRPVLVFLLAALLLAATAIVVGSRPKLPPPFGVAANGSLVYAAAGDLFVQHPTSGDRRLLVGGPEVDLIPDVSPDGTRVAFLREVGRRHEMWVIGIDGRNLVRITPEPLLAWDHYAWSPDGTEIAIASTIRAYAQVTIARTDGSGTRILDLGTPIDTPQWRPPDGRELLVRIHVGSTDKLDLAIVNADGSNVRKLGVERSGVDNVAYELLGATWSPDGTRIAYHTLYSGDIFRRHVMNADGSGNRLVTDAPENVNEGWSAFSPDGRWIGFQRWIWDVSEGLGIAPADGSTGGSLAGDMVPIQDGLGTNFNWSPDARTMIGTHTGDGSVYRIDPLSLEVTEDTFRADWVPSWQRKALP